MTKSTSLSAPKADTISTVQNWLNTESRCVLNAKKSVLFCKTNYFHHLCSEQHLLPGGDVRQCLRAFFMPVIQSYKYPYGVSLIGSVPRRSLMALQPGKVLFSGERNLFCFRKV